MTIWLMTPIDGECVDCTDQDNPCDPGEGGSDCNGCDPPIPTVLTVTITDYEYALYSGAHTVNWFSNCQWLGNANGATLVLDWTAQWYLYIRPFGSEIIMPGPYSPCDPTGAYAHPTQAISAVVSA